MNAEWWRLLDDNWNLFESFYPAPGLEPEVRTHVAPSAQKRLPITPPNKSQRRRLRRCSASSAPTWWATSAKCMREMIPPTRFSLICCMHHRPYPGGSCV
eukprot:COSAG05_NODE_4739_length_1389_cov_2.479070_1_plen_99_part_10